MLIKTRKIHETPATIAEVHGTFENAYAVAMHFWSIAGNEDIHMDGLEIWNDDDPENPKHVLTIDYTTHER